MDFLTIFITGLTTGGLTCLAVQGGLLASVIVRRGKNLSYGNQLLTVLAFLAAKLFIYTLLGFTLGAFGSVFQFSLTVRVVLQFLIAIYMIGVAGSLLNLHPIFRYFIIQPPKFLTRLVRKSSKSENFFAPFVLGLLTIFIPCGTTLAMEALAISSGSGLSGLLIMFSFILGTIPVFLALGFFAVTAGEKIQAKLYKVTAVLILILAISAMDGALTLSGSSFSIRNTVSSVSSTLTFNDSTDNNLVAENSGGEQVIKIDVSSGGYSPRSFEVKKGSPVRLDLVTNNTGGCIRAFVIPKYNIQKILPETGTTAVSFVPTEAGNVVFSCSMGMYSGEIKVI